jgi:hypothetical protein
MAYTPTSVAGVLADRVRRMVALSETFQSLCQAEGYDGALARVFVSECYDNGFPRATVWTMDTTFRQSAGGDTSYLRPAAQVHLYVAVPPIAADGTEIEEQGIRTLDTLGKVLEDVVALAGVDDHPNITAVTQANYVWLPPELWNEIDPVTNEPVGNFCFLEAVLNISDGDA